MRQSILPFQGLMGESYCKIALYENLQPIVVISELKDNNGTSATNCIEAVVMETIRKYSLDPENTIFIHHCPEGQGMFFGREDFHRVPIRWNGKIFEMTTSGKWPELTRSEVEQLIGCLFES